MKRVSRWVEVPSLPTRVTVPVILLVLLELLIFQVQAGSEFCQQHVLSKGFTCREFMVQSEDGYQLALHRVGPIPKSTLPEDMIWNPRKGAFGGGQIGLALSPHLYPADVTLSPQLATQEAPNDLSPAPAIAVESIAPAPEFVTRARGQSWGPREPVLLMHQEFLNGDSWFVHVDEHRESQLLPFDLVDEGFDVWIGHERATFWSHNHTTLKLEDKKFWNWTWDEHVMYDVPVMLKHINAEAKLPIHYIGVSQSAAVGAAAATKPSVAKLLKSLTLIGPTLYRGSGKSKSMIIRAWEAFFGNLVDARASAGDLGAFNFSREFRIKSLPLSRTTQFLSTISGPNCCIESSNIILLDNGWDGSTSYKNLLHFEQGIKSNSFQKFDYGSPTANNAAYGSKLPPPYKPNKIPVTLPVLLIYGGQDYYSPKEGIQQFLSLTKRRPVTVFLPNYAHYDLSFSARRNADVYSPIKSFLQSSR